MYDLRRNDYDVTNSVQVSSTAAVSRARSVSFLRRAWPAESFDKVAVAFDDFDKLFTGRMPGYHGVDTLYHDRQHSLDMTLAMARLLVGYERTVESRLRFGAERAAMALVTSLFHDAGYIREFDDRQHSNGAEFTLYHVTRSARFLARYLPSIGMENWVPISTRIVHFTGYEIKLNQIQLADRARPQARASARHRGLDRADGGSLLPREMPRPAVSGIRARRHRRRAPAVDGVAAGTLQLRPGSAAPDPGVRARNPRRRASRASSSMPIAISNVCSAAETPISRRSTAIWVTCTACCAPSAGRCCGEIRRCSPSDDTQIDQVRGLMLNRLKALWAY